MKFSIIVPIYKIERYLRDCVESALSQSYNDFELILVDDGSPDECPFICDEYANKDSRIVVVHKENGGLVSARKAGLAKASGEYAVCLDGDDFLHPEALSKIYPIIKECEPDVVCFGYIEYSELGERRHPVHCSRFGFFSHAEIEKEIYPNLIHTKRGQRLAPVVWSKVFKMDIYRAYQNKVHNGISMGEDSACSYPIICNCQSMYIMEECLYYYRNVSTSMTKVKKPLKWDNYDKVFNLLKKEIDLSKGDLNQQIDRARTHNLFNICMSQFYSGLSYSDVVFEIKKHFNDNPEYDKAIENSNFSSWNLIVARIVLKYRIYPLLFLYAKWK